MPINLAPLGQKIKVVKILLEEDGLRTLAEKGIVINTELSVENITDDKIICLVDDCKIVLDKIFGTKILVA